MIIGALFNRMAPVLWVIAVLGNITVIHRIIYTYQQTRERDLAATSAAVPASPLAANNTPSEVPAHH